MSCFEEEGGWSLSFSGAAFLGLYHVGVAHCLRERAPRLLQGARRIYGSSVGALNAVCILMGRPVGASGPRRAGDPGSLSSSDADLDGPEGAGVEGGGVPGPVRPAQRSVPCNASENLSTGTRVPPFSQKRGAALGAREML